MDPIYIETHAHYNLPKYEQDLDEVMGAVRKAGIKKIICPAIRYESNEQMLSKLTGYNDIFFAMGIHPKYAYKCPAAKPKSYPLTMKRLQLDYAGKLDVLDRLVEQVAALEMMSKREERVVAIGEAGLDYSQKPGAFEREVQAALFMLQVELSLRRKLPLILHVRDAHADALAILRKYRKNLEVSSGVVHCFLGGPHEAQDFLDLGLSLGIGGGITRKENESLRTTVATMPDERLLLETDAPYMTPKGYANRRNDSTAIPLIAQEIAMLRGESVEEIARITTDNAERMFFSR